MKSIVPVIVCPSCDGMTFTLDSCSCVIGGDQILIDPDVVGERPYRDCLVCRGVGSVARPCHGCGQSGRRRAQLVLTMVNLDTGRVASVNVVPGVIVPMLWSDGVSYHLPVAPLIRGLAADVGAASWVDSANPPRSANGPVIFLPRRWRPDLPEIARRVMEADALAHQSSHSWHVYLGRGTPASTRDLRRELARLCQVADLLCLDLVVEARREVPGWSWDIRYEVPGTPVPERARGWAETLPASITATSVVDALDGLATRGLTAVARYLDTARVSEPNGIQRVDVDELERRIHAAATCLDTGGNLPGAQAIWRDQRWWYTSLRAAGTVETLHERTTGQISRRERVRLRRGWQPPDPAWLGPLIPYSGCPDCHPDHRLQRCLCTLGNRPAEPDCRTCHGAGRHPSALPCHTCADSHRVHHGGIVTITNLRDQVVHLNWRAADSASGAARIIASQPGGKPIHQLPETYRLATWAQHFGVRPEDLTDTYGETIRQDLRDGIVTTDHPGNDPIVRHLNLATRGQPAARILVLAVPPDTPTLVETIRMARGLGLTVTITLEDHHLNADDPRKIHGESWDVSVSNPDDTNPPTEPATRPTPEQAAGYCLEYLELALANAVPTNPDQPIRVPAAAQPYTVEDPIPLIRQFARHHVGHPVAVRYDDAGCHLWVREHRTTSRHLATAPTLPTALTALGLKPVPAPGQPD